MHPPVDVTDRLPAALRARELRAARRRDRICTVLDVLIPLSPILIIAASLAVAALLSRGN